MNPKFKNYFKQRIKLIEKALIKYLPKDNEIPSVLNQTMKYSLFPGGKRFRPLLVLESASLFGDYKKIIPSAVAIELIHTYQIVHNDLPCIDNNSERRGKESVWKKFNEKIAILTGNALLVRAYEILTQEQLKLLKNNRENLIKLLQEISFAIGPCGVIGSQIMNITEDKKEVNTNVLKNIYLNRSVKLTIVSVKTGAILFSAKEKYINILGEYGKLCGLAAEIMDDISNFKEKDKEKYLSYPSIIGPEASETQAKNLVKEAKEKINIFKEKGKYLKDIADFIVEGKF